MPPLLIYGAGGHAKVVADTARAAGWQIRAVADGEPLKRGRSLLDWPIDLIGPEEAIRFCCMKGVSAVVAIGDNEQRRNVHHALREAGVTLAAVVHPAATVAADAKIGDGSVVFAGAVVQPGAYVEENVILNTGCSVDHDDWIGAHAHIGPGAHLGGASSVGTGAHVGLGAAIRDGVSVGAWSVVGMGSVVVRDLPALVVAYGQPARIVRPSLAPEKAA